MPSASPLDLTTRGSSGTVNGAIFSQDDTQPTGSGVVHSFVRIEGAAALMISVPEYNYSIPGPFKNAIDWVSRARPMPWRGRTVYLMSAAPSPMGGIRGLWQTRIPLEGCGAIVFPDMFALPHGSTAFDEHGSLRDPALFERLFRDVRGFVRFAEAVEPLCCAPPPAEDARKRAQEIAAALENETELQQSS